MARSTARAAGPPRSTSASTSTGGGAKGAKPLPRRAPAPPASSPAPGLAPLLAGLLALIEAHRASAAEGPAAVVLRVLGEVAAMALRFAAAPGAWRLHGVSGLQLAGLELIRADLPPSATPTIEEMTGEDERDILLGELREMLAGFTDEKPARPEAAPLVAALRELVANPPAPASRPQPDDFAPLLAGLGALARAHAGASSPQARALLAAIDAIRGKARLFAEAPPGSRELAAHAGSIAGLSCFHAPNEEEGTWRFKKMSEDAHSPDPVLAALHDDINAALAPWTFPGRVTLSPLGPSEAAGTVAATIIEVLWMAERHLENPIWTRIVSDSGGDDVVLRLETHGEPRAPLPTLPHVPAEEHAPGARPLGELHSVLASQTLLALEHLGEVGGALDGADDEACRLLKPDGGGATIGSVRGDLEEARGALRLALCSLCELSAALTGESAGRSMAAHAAALARLELLSEAERGRDDWAKASRKSASGAFRDNGV